MRWLLATCLLASLGAAELLRGTRSGGRRLKVAYAIFVTDLQSRDWQDAMAIMAHGLQKVKAKSRHDATALVLAPERLPDEAKEMLLSFGFDNVERRPVPVPLAEIQSPVARAEMGHTQGNGKGLTFALEEETIKYWGLALTEYDRVVVLDADTIVMDPMDELMELEDDFVGTYDFGVDCCGSRIPPVQGGFLLVRPNLTDFENVKALTREGDWQPGLGWKSSHIGYWYGGIGPDGLLQYYFNKDALEKLPPIQIEHRELEEGIAKPSQPGSRMKVVDRDVYDVLLTDRLTRDLKDRDLATVARGVKAAHFTGNCMKPWSCVDVDPSRPGMGLCDALHARWGEMWAEIAAKRLGGSPAAVSGSYCKDGRYVDLPAVPKP
mmetsp:Transcript_70832/g.187875  ORF Transcript_70832/g.187875 Transcript_70832/m.187875 type:complete len:379 (-) Transcript_70832:109-1245(-)